MHASNTLTWMGLQVVGLSVRQESQCSVLIFAVDWSLDAMASMTMALFRVPTLGLASSAMGYVPFLYPGLSIPCDY